ncbi:MAG TPA: hypothetical protein VLE70_06760 [Anaerolineae bacterium]|nr:hypothetical protein [Anaerolineae bacterium]
MTRLAVQLLGPFVASYGEQPLSHFRTRAVQALLIYLVNQPEAHRRESLMALLWPDVTRESAQNSLRQALYHLRQTIPEVNAKNGDQPIPFLLSDRQMVQVNPEAAYDLDVAAFERGLRGPEAGWPDAVAGRGRGPANDCRRAAGRGRSGELSGRRAARRGPGRPGHVGRGKPAS